MFVRLRADSMASILVVGHTLKPSHLLDTVR